MLVWGESAEEIQLDLFRCGAQCQPGIVVGEQGLKKLYLNNLAMLEVEIIVWHFGYGESESANKSCGVMATKNLVFSFGNGDDILQLIYSELS